MAVARGRTHRLEALRLEEASAPVLRGQGQSWKTQVEEEAPARQEHGFLERGQRNQDRPVLPEKNAPALAALLAAPESEGASATVELAEAVAGPRWMAVAGEPWFFFYDGLRRRSRNHC